MTETAADPVVELQRIAQEVPKEAPKPKRKSTRSGITIPQLRDALHQLFAASGTMLYIRDQVCGTAVLEGSGQLADSLATVAEQNPRVRRALERLITGGAWGSVALAAANIALPIMRHHNLIPEVKAEAKPPEESADAASGNGSGGEHSVEPVPIL